MMLREGFGLIEQANAIETAVKRTVGSGIRTIDIASAHSTVVGTQAMADHVANALHEICAKIPVIK